MRNLVFSRHRAKLTDNCSFDSHVFRKQCREENASQLVVADVAINQIGNKKTTLVQKNITHDHRLIFHIHLQVLQRSEVGDVGDRATETIVGGNAVCSIIGNPEVVRLNYTKKDGYQRLTHKTCRLDSSSGSSGSSRPKFARSPGKSPVSSLNDTSLNTTARLAFQCVSNK